jgi:hypothetical protein
MVFSVHLQRSAVAAIVNCSVRGQFSGSWSLKPVAPQPIWLFQESLITAHAFKPVLRTGEEVAPLDLAVEICHLDPPRQNQRGHLGWVELQQEQ